MRSAWQWMVGGLVATLGLSYLAAHRHVKVAESRYPPIGDFVTVEGVRLHYLCRGQGPPIIMLHGNTGLLQDFSLTIMDKLTEEFRTCAFDRPGHGYSQRPSDATAEVQARLIHGAAELLGLEKPILVGHSWSGALVLAYTLQYPDDVSGVVLLGAQTHPAPAPNPIKHWLLRSPVLGDIVRWTFWPLAADRRARNNLELAYGPNPLIPELVDLATALWGRPGQEKATAEDFITVGPSLERMVCRYGEIRVPVMIIVGSDDPFVDIDLQGRSLVERVALASLITLADTGHQIAQSRPEQVIAAIKKVSTS